MMFLLPKQAFDAPQKFKCMTRVLTSDWYDM